jgi:hypothetical protein
MAFYDQSGSFFVGETEEERRRREEEEAAKNAVPFKQTIVTDPVTGKQTMKMEGAVEDFTAANPNTPTVTAPVAPEMGPPREAMMPAQDASNSFFTDYYNKRLGDVNQRIDAVSGMVRDPDAYMRQRLGMQPTTTAPTVEGVLTGPPRDAMMPVSAAPAVPTEMGPPRSAMMPTEEKPMSMAARAAVERQPQPQTTTAPTAEGVAMGPQTSAMTETAWADRFISAQQDPNQMAALQADPNQPEWLRRLAADQNYQAVKQQKDQQRVESKVTKAIETGDMLGLAREIKKSGEDGSIIKAYLYSRFGLNDLAKQEQEKLGAGLKWETSADSKGNTALVQYSGDGLPLKGFDATGKQLTAEQLAGFTSGGSKNLDIVGGTYVNDQTGDVGRVVTDKRTGRSYIQTDTGVKPMTGFRPQASGGSLADQRARLVQEINLRLQGKGKEESMAILREYNSKLVGQGFSPIQPTELNINVGQISGGAPAPATGAVAPTTAAPTTAASTTAAVAPAVPGTRTAPATTATPVATAPALASAPAGRRPTMTEIEAQGTAEKKVAEVTAEDRAKIINNYGQIKENVDIIENLGKELVNHPGFSVSVGASVQPGFQFIPGTDKASFYSRFEEIKGKQFLAAIETLKGTGAISDAEGRAATAAVSRLSTAQNEQEFRKAQHEFTSMMKRYADRASIKVGREPIYNEPTMSQQVKENAEAKRWLQKNSKDPRAEGVRQKLRERGEL